MRACTIHDWDTSGDAGTFALDITTISIIGAEPTHTSLYRMRTPEAHIIIESTWARLDFKNCLVTAYPELQKTV